MCVFCPNCTNCCGAASPATDAGTRSEEAAGTEPDLEQGGKDNEADREERRFDGGTRPWRVGILGADQAYFPSCTIAKTDFALKPASSVHEEAHSGTGLSQAEV